MKRFLHALVFLILTILTQVGGVIYLISLFLFRKKENHKKVYQLAFFFILYLLSTFFLIPQLAPLFGREKIKEGKHLRAHSWVYKAMNRNYVKPELNRVLNEIAIELEQKHQNIQLVYLDANFPFIDGFPLLPHLSHKDGKKIDLSFIYENEKGEMVNVKRARSGYGIFEQPTSKEKNQVVVCRAAGNPFYDYTKYLSLGTINEDISLSNKGTKTMVNLIVEAQSVEKLFIEPHLKKRLNLQSKKVRFHGCGAVRHDDHIHIQIQ